MLKVFINSSKELRQNNSHNNPANEMLQGLYDEEIDEDDIMNNIEL